MAWPPVPDRAVFDGVLESCLDASTRGGRALFPGGGSLARGLGRGSALRLYGPDGFHPAPLGTYLAALVVYEGSTGHDAQRLPEQAVVQGQTLSVPAGTVMMLQRGRTRRGSESRLSWVNDRQIPLYLRAILFLPRRKLELPSYSRERLVHSESGSDRSCLADTPPGSRK